MTIEATMGPLAGEGVFSTSSFAFVITTQGFRDFPAIIQRQQAANSVPVLSTSVLPTPTLVVPPLDQTSLSTSLSSTDIQTVPTTTDSETTSQIAEETAVVPVPPPPASPTAIANPDPSPEEGITKPTENADISGLTPGAKIGIALGVLIGNAFIIGSLAYFCARKGFVISIPLLGPRKKLSATEKGGEYGTKSLPRVYASEMDGVAPAVELEAQRGPFELEARTSFYRRSLAVVRSASRRIRSTATSVTGDRRSFDADTLTIYSGSTTTRPSMESRGLPLPTPSDYSGKERRFTFGAAPGQLDDQSDTLNASGPGQSLRPISQALT